MVPALMMQHWVNVSEYGVWVSEIVIKKFGLVYFSH